MFSDGKRQQEYSKNCLLPASGRLLPEFDLDKRRNIKDMFSRKPTCVSSNSNDVVATPATIAGTQFMESQAVRSNPSPDNSGQKAAACTTETIQSPQTTSRKRSQPMSTAFSKRPKPAAVTSSTIPMGGQKTLKGFFKPKAINDVRPVQSSLTVPISRTSPLNCETSKPSQEDETASFIDSQNSPRTEKDIITATKEGNTCAQAATASNLINNDLIVDPIASKEDWSKLFTKKPAPSCDGHKEPCISLTTKKSGMNRGRLFWICSRPLGPNGEKSKGTQWRCPTFIWASDWNSSAGSQEQ